MNRNILVDKLRYMTIIGLMSSYIIFLYKRIYPKKIKIVDFQDEVSNVDLVILYINEKQKIKAVNLGSKPVLIERVRLRTYLNLEELSKLAQNDSYDNLKINKRVIASGEEIELSSKVLESVIYSILEEVRLESNNGNYHGAVEKHIKNSNKYVIELTYKTSPNERLIYFKEYALITDIDILAVSNQDESVLSLKVMKPVKIIDER